MLSNDQSLRIAVLILWAKATAALYYYSCKPSFLRNEAAIKLGEPNFGQWIWPIALTIGLLDVLPIALVALSFIVFGRESKQGYLTATVLGIFFIIYRGLIETQWRDKEFHLAIAMQLVGGMVISAIALASLYFAKKRFLKPSVTKFNQGVLTSL